MLGVFLIWTWHFDRTLKGPKGGNPPNERFEVLAEWFNFASMRILIQRVTKASVAVEGDMIGRIGSGLLILLGIEGEDGPEDIDYLCGKLTRLRIFGDEEGKMNRSVMDIHGGLLVVSQFTLYASTKKGNRPGFTRSAPPAVAIPLYEQFVARLGEMAGRSVATGEFAADMQVALVNDGPVTIWMDSRARE